MTMILVTIENIIHFFITYNEKIISLTFGAIIVLSVLVVYWQIFGKKKLKGEGASDLDVSDIEKTLQKILNQTNSAILNMGTDAKAGMGASSDELNAMKKELGVKASLVEDLKKQVQEVMESENSSGELLAKIKTLEGRLAEYEIIEDDIADLSLYKDENEKLKREIEGLKRGGAELVDQFAEAVQAAQASSPAAAQEQVVLHEVASDLASDLESSVAQVQKEVAPPTPPPAVAEKNDDIFGEFSSDISDDPMAELGDIDTNRMLDELKDLNVDLDIGAEALEESPDIDKMAEEAKNLEGKKLK